MSRRTLTDSQWSRIEPLFPGKKGDRGRSGTDNRLFVDAVLWLVRPSAGTGQLADGALPLPALDGGRLLFLIVEVIRGKRVDPDKEGMVHFIGMMLLFALMFFTFFNDIRKLFG